MSEAPLRVAIIGYGLAGSVFHAPLVASTEGMQVAAIVTSNPERQAGAHRDFPQAEVLASVNEIWAHPERYDLVAVAATNEAHVPLARAAIEHGLPVVVDKPIATSSSDAEDLIDLAERRGVALTVFQNRRWDGDYRTVRRVIEAGTLGPIARYASYFDRFRPAVRAGVWREHTPFAEGGGLLWDLGSHLIDAALLLFGPPTQVYAEMGRRRPGAEVDDDTLVLVTFAGGETAELGMSVVTRLPRPRFLIHGLQGSYEKHGLDPQENALRSGWRPGNPNWERETADVPGRLAIDVNGLSVDGTVETLPGTYQEFYRLMRDALRDGSPVPVDPRGAMLTTRVIEAARNSAESGRAISLRQ